jgi:phosphoribosylglycinamide formyltransferase 2
MVTMISQYLSIFALHARAILDLPIPNIHFHGPSASAVILAQGESSQLSFHHLERALAQADTQIRLFGKPQVSGRRRMGVALARAQDCDKAKAQALAMTASIDLRLQQPDS